MTAIAQFTSHNVYAVNIKMNAKCGDIKTIFMPKQLRRQSIFCFAGNCASFLEDVGDVEEEALIFIHFPRRENLRKSYEQVVAKVVAEIISNSSLDSREKNFYSISYQV